jgi:hypothetical protein
VRVWLCPLPVCEFRPFASSKLTFSIYKWSKW